MAKNSYFKYVNSESRLMEDLTIETIKMYGEDVVYIARDSISRDDLFGEDISSKFNKVANIEVYIKNYDAQEGSELFSRFGIELKDRMRLVVSRRRFEDEVTKIYPEVFRPRPGDLIYFPLINRTIYEITGLEADTPFFQGNKLYTYEILAQVYGYDHDSMETGITVVDEAQQESQDLLTYIDIDGMNGTFLNGETVYVGESYNDSSFSGIVTNWSPSQPGTMYLKSVEGNLVSVIGSVITGQDSGATALVAADLGNTANYLYDSTDPFGNNDVIQRESRTIIDFSEVDPFSEGNY
jgi:hypothetical protein